jgi:hypothetical protein
MAQMKWFFRPLVLVSLVLTVEFTLPFSVQTAHAATQIVTNLNDSGPGSLRDAISTASAGDVLTFNPILAGQSILLNSVIEIDKDLTIDGTGLTSPINLSGNYKTGVLHIQTGVTVALKKINLIQGIAGGIVNDGTLSISNVQVSGNARSFSGGGIENTGNLTVTDSTISGNCEEGPMGGGGIFNSGALTIENSTISGNMAGNYCEVFGITSPSRSTSTDNNGNTNGLYLYSGGGIYNTGSLTVTNSTFYTNSAREKGAGIYNDNIGTATITNSTFSEPRADGNHLIIYNDGLLSLFNTILSVNSLNIPQCSGEGTLSAYSHNLTLGDAACGIPFSTADPLLGTLQYDGGPTNTIALKSGSPAIDNGDPDKCPTTDQRGISRSKGAGCDIGSYELDPNVAAVTIDQAPNQGDPTNITPILFKAVFSRPVTGFTKTDAMVSGPTGAKVVSVSEIDPYDGTTYSVAIGEITSEFGVVHVWIPYSAALDAEGKVSSASTSIDNEVFYSIYAPTVIINQAPSQSDPTKTSPIRFKVVFSKAVQDFVTGDVSLSGTAGAKTAQVQEIYPNNGTTYMVIVRGMTQNGTVKVSIPGGVARELTMGHPNIASTSTDNVVTLKADILSASVSSLDFGKQLVFTTGPTHMVTLTNHAPFSINTDTVSVPFWLQVNKNTCNNASLEQNDTCVLKVSFKPRTIRASSGLRMMAITRHLN